MRRVRLYPRTGGFTLVEILIVVVLLAVLAAAVIPHVGNAVVDAKHSTLLDNQHELNLAIQRYRAEHGGTLPAGVRRLASRTDSSGAVDSDGKYGPYILAIPLNPLNNSRTIIRVSNLASVDLTNYAGWVWDDSSGQIAGGLSPDATANGAGVLELGDDAVAAAVAVGDADLSGN
jgi:general secretion pathway protein G